MKAKLIAIAVIFGFLLCSCSNVEEPRYSCDPNVDEWVKDHIREIHSMSRAEWLESDAEYSTPIYRAFTPEQRIDFWREKFLELKALSWSNGEIALIEEAESFFENHLDLFGPAKPTDEQLDEVELFFYKWREKAKKHFSWSDQLIKTIVASGEKLLDTKGTIYQKSKSSGIVLTTSSEVCDCHVGSLVTCDYNSTCGDAKCTGQSWGCGFFLAWECNGMCVDNFQPTQNI